MGDVARGASRGDLAPGCGRGKGKDGERVRGVNESVVERMMKGWIEGS